MPFIQLNYEKGAAARRLYHKSLEIATDAEKYMPFIHLNREKRGRRLAAYIIKTQK